MSYWYIVPGMAKKGWRVRIGKQVSKERDFLPKQVCCSLNLLLEELAERGSPVSPVKNYGKLGKNIYHCHLKKGSPTYVVCWKRLKKEKTIEVYYAGTHEKAPY